MPTVESNEAVDKVAPVGLNDSDLTVRVCDEGIVDWRPNLYRELEAGVDSELASVEAGAGENEYILIDLSEEQDAKMGAACDQATCQAAEIG